MVVRTQRLRAVLAAIGIGIGVSGCATISPTLPQTSQNIPALSAPPTQSAPRQSWVDWQALLKEHLVAYPDDASAYARLGQACSYLGEWQAAQEAFERSLALDSRQLDARLRLAVLLADAGDTKSALRQVDRVLKENDRLGEAHALRGRLLGVLGRNDEAIAAYRAGWSVHPPSVLAGLELSRWDVQHRQLSEARDRLRLCLAYEPSNVEASRLLATVLEKEGNTPNAIRQWESLANRGETGAGAYWQLARLYHAQGDWPRAFEALERGRRLAPEAAEIADIEQQLASSPVPSAILSADYRPLQTEPR